MLHNENILFPVRPLVETILRKIPLEMMERIRRRRGTTIETVDFGSDPPTEKTLIKLHRQVIKALQTHHRTETQWNDWTNKVFELEDVNRNMVCYKSNQCYLVLKDMKAQFSDIFLSHSHVSTKKS